MRNRKRISTLAGIGLAFAAILGFSGTSAFAAPTTVTAGPGHSATSQSASKTGMAASLGTRVTLAPNTQPSGVGVSGHVDFDHASLFQCPETFCNTGEAEAANDTAGICFLPGTTGFQGVLPWILVLDHANNVAGFMAEDFWTPTVPGSVLPACGSAGIGVHVNFDHASLFQCPETFCNTGEAEAANDVAAFCFLPGTTGFEGVEPWVLVLDHANNVTGFIANDFLTADVPGSEVNPC